MLFQFLRFKPAPLQGRPHNFQFWYLLIICLSTDRIAGIIAATIIVSNPQEERGGGHFFQTNCSLLGSQPIVVRRRKLYSRPEANAQNGNMGAFSRREMSPSLSVCRALYPKPAPPLKSVL